MAVYTFKNGFFFFALGNRKGQMSSELGQTGSVQDGFYSGD